jgi:hypothetical protein
MTDKWSEFNFYAIIVGITRILEILDSIHPRCDSEYKTIDSGAAYQNFILNKRKEYNI